MAYIINITGGSSDGITEQEALAYLAQKQDKLYDTTMTIPQGKSANIKTVNGVSLIDGNGTNISI